MAKRFLVLIALLMLGFFIAGCSEGDKSTSVVNPNPNVFSPTGSISGVVFDQCKLAPVSGAVVSVAYAGGVHQVTTGATGAFSFTGVPAITNARYEDSESDGYWVTCDLTKVTGYGYALVNQAYVTYEDLGDGTNLDLAEGNGATESGSGASTPVNNLAFTTEFDVGPLTSSIAGTIYDVSTGRALTGATVSLFLGSNFIATTTASATGAYSFANIMWGDDYYLMVTKAGYDYAKFQEANTVTAPSGTPATGKPGIASCNLVKVTCEVGCSEALANVDVNLIANPAKDITVPYIVSVDAGALTDVINGDSYPSATTASITNFVATFSESMVSDRTLKGNAVTLASAFTITATSTGPLPSGGTAKTYTRSTAGGTAIPENIIASYTVTMTSAGVMTITPTLKAAADYLLETWWTNAGQTAEHGSVAQALGTTPTFAISTVGTYTVHLIQSPHLTDLSFIEWSEGTPGALDGSGFLHAFGEAYQDVFILPSGSMTITIGQ